MALQSVMIYHVHETACNLMRKQSMQFSKQKRLKSIEACAAAANLAY
jgi:hypothetical protein